MRTLPSSLPNKNKREVYVTDRRARAVASYKGPNIQVLQQALNTEEIVAECLKGRTTPHTCPVDIIVDDCGVAIEVKTVQLSNSGHIFMNSRAKLLKHEYAKEKNLRLFTVAVDLRSSVPQYYVREGIGCFRLVNMRRVASLRAIRLQLLSSNKPREPQLWAATV